MMLVDKLRQQWRNEYLRKTLLYETELITRYGNL